MLPLKDNVRSSTTPYVNYALIAICVLVYLAQARSHNGLRDPLIERYGMVPARVFNPDTPIQVYQSDRWGRLFRTTVEAPSFHPWLTVLTCIFLHGGWMHLLGNMWFLYIFGDNVEDRLGHWGYLLFYLAWGVAASATHLFTNQGSTVPTVGASGAIAGVMGAYFLLYPRAQVLTLLPIFYFIQIIVVPATLFLGFWFFLQFFQGTLAGMNQEAGGVAWWAHVGGFVAGFGSGYLLRKGGWLKSARPPESFHSHRFQMRRPRW